MEETPMDFGQLAHEVTALLVPLLPYLEGAGGKIAEGVGESVWEGAKALWGKLRPRVAAKESGREAVAKVIERPTDSRAMGTLELQLEELLAADTSFASEIAKLLEATGPRAAWAHLTGDGAIAQGDGAVAAGKNGIAGGRNVIIGEPLLGSLRRPQEDE
jgi:hypothetical protein